MKRSLTFILICAFGFFCQGQVKTAEYDALVNNEIPELGPGETLVVKNITTSSYADELQVTYNGGETITGIKSSDGRGFSKSFVIPAGARQVRIRIDSHTSYDRPLGGTTGPGRGATTPPLANGSTGVLDEDHLDRAIWAAIAMYAIMSEHHAANGTINATELHQILSRYISPARLASVYNNDYGNWISTNPFILGIGGSNLYPAPDLASLNNGLTEVVGGIDVTKYVQAFADFLRERIKQELTIAYLEKFKQALENNKQIRELLPKTWATFKDNDIFNLPSMGATYKDAFATDLAHLTDNFIAYVKRNDFAGLAAANQEAFIIGSGMYSFIAQMAKGNHPSTALHTTALQNPYNPVAPLTSTYIIAVTDMLSQHLLAKTGDRWIALETVEQLNPDIIRIFFGLLYDKYPELFDATHLSGRLRDLAGDSGVQQRFNDIYNFVVLAQNIDQRIEEFKELKKNPGSLTSAEKKETALDFFLSNSDVLTDLVKTSFTLVSMDDVYDERYALLISGLTDAIDIAKAVRSNNLPKATNAAISFITTVVGSEDNKKWITSLKNILAFTNDLVAAKSSDEIEAVIENYAAPVQSYRVIRKSRFSAALTAYPGLYVGSERNSDTDTKLFEYGSFGVTAPLGLAFSTGPGDGDGWSKTVYLSVFDIGAALSYRFGDATEDIPDKITLAQIFSPGVHLVLGIKNSPLAIKAGYQYAPQLRDISTESVSVDNAAVWRLSIGIAVDIPVYIFTSKQ